MKYHFKPENFQKRVTQKNYFEGWYYKFVSKDKKNIISFIPGVSFSKEENHAFIQCIHLDEHKNLNTYNIEYPITAFESQNKPFGAKIYHSTFSLSKCLIMIESSGYEVDANLILSNLTPIKRSLLTPNIMGFFSYFPFMECNHGVISMHHNLNGSVKINGKEINFDGGVGYIEKDFGKSFPSKYLWAQSNHFGNDSALFFSMANIPFLGFNFDGFICNFIYNGVEYRFATYNNSRIKVINVSPKAFEVSLRKGKLELLIKANISDSKQLLAPRNGMMTNIIKEALGGNIAVVLRKKNEVIYSSSSDCCGIEIVNF